MFTILRSQFPHREKISAYLKHELKMKKDNSIKICLSFIRKTKLHFQVSFEGEITILRPTVLGVPQGSVLGPILCSLYTADLLTRDLTNTAIFAKDSSILAVDPNPQAASQQLQCRLTLVQEWCHRRRQSQYQRVEVYS